MKNNPFVIVYMLLAMVLMSCATKKSFNIVLLPDTQTYSRAYPEIFMSQTKWIAENSDSIAFVLHQGDITDWNTDNEWQVASKAMQMLDGKVPYTVVPGNHDTGAPPYAFHTKTRATDLFNVYFPYEKYSEYKSFGGAFEEGKMDNTWHTFKAGGYNWLILSLEFGPRNSVLQWAGDIIKDHPKHKVIINTHAYMYSDDTRMSADRNHNWRPQSYGIGNDTGDNAVNDGEQMWKKLVSQYANVLLVFSGHVLHDGTGTLESTGLHGNTVYQMLANYQGGVKDAVKGGNGFLRKLTIDPVKQKIFVKTYSPYINEYKTGPDQQFVIENVQFNSIPDKGKR